MKKRERNDKGLTLIELLVALAIVSVVVSLAFGLIIHTVRIYTRGNNESVVQNDAQLTMAQLESLVLNANMGIGLDPDSASPDNKNLYLYYRDYEQTSYNVKADGTDEENTEKIQYQALHIYLDPQKGLSYCTRTCKYKADNSSGTVVNKMEMSDDKKNPQVLSKYVKDFSVDLSQLEDKSEMKVTLKFDHRGQNYESTNSIMLRNKVAKLDNGNAGNYFQILDEQVKKNNVTSIQMERLGDTSNPLPPHPEASYFVGSEFANPFIAKYDYSDGTSGSGQTIWTLEDGVTGVEINRQTGFISIKPEFSGDEFKVYATALSAVNNKLEIKEGVNQTYGTIKVKSIQNPPGIVFTSDPSNPSNVKEKVATLGFSTKNFEDTDVMKMHLQVTEGMELRPSISSGTLGVDGVVSYQISVHRPISYKGKTFPIKISCSVNENTKLEVAGTVEFATTAGPDDEFDGVTIIACGSNGVPQRVTGTSPITLQRNEQATFKMVAGYKNTGTISSEVDVSTKEWKLTPPDNVSEQIALKVDNDEYTLNCNVKDYNQKVEIPLTSSYLDEDGTWKAGPVVTLTFPKINLILKNVLDPNQEAYPITRGKSQTLYFDCGETGSTSLRVAGSLPGSKLSVSLSGLNASVTASTSMTAPETVNFGLKSGSTNLEGVEYPVKFYAGAVNTRDRSGGSLKDANKQYVMYIPYVNELSRFDSTQTLTESVKFSIYTADGKQLLYSKGVKDGVDGNKHQYWVMVSDSTGAGKTFYYDAVARQWRLNE